MSRWHGQNARVIIQAPRADRHPVSIVKAVPREAALGPCQTLQVLVRLCGNMEAFVGGTGPCNPALMRWYGVESRRAEVMAFHSIWRRVMVMKQTKCDVKIIELRAFFMNGH